ncbi:MAG: hypothetical protein EHM34_07110 [Nitrosopumilales archaeon]|nr:MAG: hypothetical protein EHM34_07110 [Nitrosopumilales archaeon]
MKKKKEDTYKIDEKAIATGRVFRLPETTGEWTIVYEAEICDICGYKESNSYRDGKCFVCWYNTNPGALASP